MFRYLLSGSSLARLAGQVFVVTLAAALVWGAENSKKPISRDRLFKAVEIGGLTNDEFINILKDFGVDFELNAEDRQNLAKANVDPMVVNAISANFRDPIREKVSQLTQGGPLSKENIIGLLKAGAGSEIIEALVEKRGVSFAMTPADAKEIEGAGGNKGLVGALFLKEPVKIAVAEPPPAAPPPAKEVTLVAAATPAAIVPPPQEIAKPDPPPVTPPAAAPAPQPAASTPPPVGAKPINQAAALLTSTAKPAKLLKGGVQFSEAARRVHATGKVLMEIVINEQGRVESMKALTGNPLLVMSATQSMKDWIYEPATVDGRPTKVSTQVSVDFQ